MGNTNCVASGGCPHRADILVVNNTKYDLELDTSVPCQRECNHSGWQVQDGKIVEGCEPPDLIKAHDNARFSVSGREATAVAPKGRVCYINKEKNLKVTFEWMYSGSTSMTSSDANMTINGLKESKKGIFGGGDGKPWTDFLACEAKTDPWVFTLRPREGKLDETLRLAQKLAEDGVGVKI